MELVKKIFFVFLALFLFSSLTKNFADYIRNIGFYNDYKKEYEKENKRNITLKTKIVRSSDPYELEKRIRNDLGLVRSDEVAIVLPEPTKAPPVVTPTAAPVWRQWQKIFFSQN